MTNLTNAHSNPGNRAMNNTAKVSAMAQALFSKGLEPIQSLALASSLIEMKEKIGHTNWERVMDRTVRNMPVTVDGETYTGIEIEGWLDVLTRANLIIRSADGELAEGPYLTSLYEEKEKAYPREEIGNRRRKLKNKCDGMVKTISVLESTKYTVDEVMLKLGMQVYAKLGKCKLTSEQYVLDGCFKLVNDGNLPVVSEFFDDHRGRLNQGDVHGPNGQASDMARSMMDLHGVETNYDPEIAAKYIMEEMLDMCKLSEEGILQEVSTISTMTFGNISDYMVAAIRDNRSPITKVWSFIKAAGLLIKLGRGETPHIGMAFGLDAKCSGPQLAALLTDDEELAQACGFSETNVADAYERAIVLLDSSWDSMSRNSIKKPYMATFYGQNWRALTISDNYGRTKKSDMEMSVLDCMLNGAGVNRDTDPTIVEEIVHLHWDERAQELAGAIEKSFGKVSTLRKAIKDAHGSWEANLNGDVEWVAKTHKATTHVMPDGVKVRMPYYTYVDITNTHMDYGMVAPTVEIIVRGEDMKFNMMTFKTNNVDLGRHGRAGFVNMIQATDAQLARYIICNLHDLGAKHVVSVHDCFRVNINDMIGGKLVEAIKMAYMELVGSVSNERTEQSPRGTDITGMYFQGVNKSKEKKGYVHSQFEDGERTLQDFMDIPQLVSELGTKTYFFAK